MANGRTRKKKGTKLTLEFVEEPKKLHVKPLKCMNTAQKQFARSIENKEVTICSGCPGSGKTYVSLNVALKMLEKQQIDLILLVKSVTQIKNEELGFLKGDLTEKLDPFMNSFYSNIDKIIGLDQRKMLVDKERIKVTPLAFIRGCQFDRCVLIMDECLNITMDIFKTLMTRIGYGSRYIFLGDLEQCDLKYKSMAALPKIMKIFEDDPNVGIVTFSDDDCVRNPIIPNILEKLRKFELQELEQKINKKKED